jgi:hypothetical protein
MNFKTYIGELLKTIEKLIHQVSKKLGNVKGDWQIEREWGNR